MNEEKGTMRRIFFLGKHIEEEKVAGSEGAEHVKRQSECHGAIINAELTKGTLASSRP
ncbi:MAG TPA: hypothetical protein VK357_04705 [Rubrobacteraceae bacterium]|nr:hypothetical protein [Rubrobacteraceae bacterium]